MKLNKAIRPYSAKVSKKGDMTIFYCVDSEKTKDGKWKSTPPYMVGVKNINFPIPDKNPEGFKIVPRSIEGMNLNGYQGRVNVTAWCSDIEIQDKDGNTIIESTKKAAKYLGKKLEDIKAAEDDTEDLPF